MSELQPWRMSIVGHGEVDPRTLVAHPLNPKVHPAAQHAVVEASLRELGWVKSAIVNQTTGHLLDGHERVELAIARGEALVPVEYVAIPATDEGKALLLLDQSAALAEPHLERWAQLRAEVQTDEPALVTFFGDWAAQHGLPTGDAPVPAPIVEADVGEERLAEVRAKWPVEPGDLWVAGRHRLLCGDCRVPATLERLLDGVTPTMVLADPPYGVSIVQGNGFVGGGEAYAIPFGGVKRDARQRVSGGQRARDRTGQYPIETWGKEAPRGQVGHHAPRRAPVGKYAPVLGDETTATAIAVVMQLLAAYPQAVHVWWGGNYYANTLPASTCWLVWDKETTGNFADCELAWTNVPKAARLFRHRWNGMLRDSERERRWHPTQKPAALMAWVYEVLGQAGDVVLDPFLGSGPTLIAAEQRGQTLYGCDLSPDYIGIALERWALVSGKTPRRVEDKM